MGVRREGGDSIDIQWREIDDFSLCLGLGEPDDLAGEISYNSDDGRLGPTDFHKTGSGGLGKT
jgi:hypothetical protein